tara:strand:+ start:148 stop:1287 length:1140 start_codon:yes stop_codon:yes gene_type:complete
MISFLKKNRRLINLVINSKFTFQKPDKKKFLIIDGRKKNLLFRYLNRKKCNIIHTRGETMNLYVFFVSLFTVNFSNLYINYINTFIRITKPKFCITLNHPKIYFYKLKNIHKNLTTIVFQNGHINLNKKNIFFKELLNENKKNLKVDYIFSHNSFFSKNLFQRFIKAKYINTGSFRNNFFFKKKINNKKKIIYFISQFRMPESIRSMGYSYEQFYITEFLILPKIFNFAKKNNFSFEILGSEWNSFEEKKFYSKILNNNDWIYHKKNRDGKSYYRTDHASINIFVDSNLGFESLARGNKTISFNFKRKIDPMYNKFGLKFLNEKGKFWTNIDSDNEFYRLMNYAKNVNSINWKRDNTKIIKKIMEYDPDNRELKKIILN